MTTPVRIATPVRIGKQQSAILKVLQGAGEKGKFEWEIIKEVSPISRDADLFGGSYPVDKEKKYASVSRSLRLLKIAKYVEKVVWAIEDKMSPCGHLTFRVWVITEEGSNLLKVKSRHLTFTGASQ